MEKFSSHEAKKFTVALGIVNFALQYAWENLQCGPFFNASTIYMAAGMFIAAVGGCGYNFHRLCRHCISIRFMEMAFKNMGEKAMDFDDNHRPYCKYITWAFGKNL